MSSKVPYDHYIITHSDSVSAFIKIRDLVLTAALWLVYLYFIRQAWYFLADVVHWALNGFDDVTQYPSLVLVPTIKSYGQVAAGMTALYLGWALYNMLRFRGRQRRKARPPVSTEELATMYGFSQETVVSWQEAASLVMHHDAEGHLTDVKIVK